MPKKYEGPHAYLGSLMDRLNGHDKIKKKKIVAILITPIDPRISARDPEHPDDQYDYRVFIHYKNQDGFSEGKHRTSCVWDGIK